MQNNSEEQGLGQAETQGDESRAFADERSFSDYGPQNIQNISKSQKIAVGFLAFFGLAVVVLWGVQTRNRLRAPFYYAGTTAGNNQTASSCDGLDCPKVQEELKAKDTDGDGLSDWDELKIYNTSPYLEDTDSDGYKDGQEVTSGNDPNCPQGRICSNIGVTEQEAGQTNQEVQSSNFLNLPMPSSAPQQSSTESLDSTTLSQKDEEYQQLLSGQSDAKAIRRLLISSGMDQKVLDQISDEELIKQYQAVFAGNQQALNGQ